MTVTERCGVFQEKCYFITFARYGHRLHGNESGSVDRSHNLPGNRLLEADPRRASADRQRMNQAPYWLDRNSRAAVLEAKSYASRSLNRLLHDGADRAPWKHAMVIEGSGCPVFVADAV